MILFADFEYVFVKILRVLGDIIILVVADYDSLFFGGKVFVFFLKSMYLIGFQWRFDIAFILVL